MIARGRGATTAAAPPETGPVVSNASPARSPPVPRRTSLLAFLSVRKGHTPQPDPARGREAALEIGPVEEVGDLAEQPQAPPLRNAQVVARHEIRLHEALEAIRAARERHRIEDGGQIAVRGGQGESRLEAPQPLRGNQGEL